MRAKTQTILTSIHNLMMSENFKETHRNSPKSFVRDRILGFSDFIIIQVSMLIKSLSIEIDKALILLSSPYFYTKQAFSQGRKKLKHSAFEALNNDLVKNYYQTPPFDTYKGKYLLVAVDGSLIQLPDADELATFFGTWKNQTDKTMPMARCSVAYDLLNKIVIAADFAPCITGEHQLYESHLNTERTCFQSNIKLPRLYLMDRNYPSLKKIIDIPLAGNSYLIRCKAGFCPEVVDFVNSNQEEAILTLKITNKRIHNTSLKTHTDLPNEVVTRIVRVLLPTQEYEYLLTNTDFTVEELSQLYHLRWGVESYYCVLKEKMQLENFSSKTVEGVKQDFFAKILTSNIASLLINDAQSQIDEEQKDKKVTNKHAYIINQNIALGIIKDEIIKLLINQSISIQHYDDIIDRIKRHKVPVRPNRNFHRHKQKRSKRKFFINKRSGV
jgi:hypothetical protein